MTIRFGSIFAAGVLATLLQSPAYSLTLESPVERVNLLELYTSHGCSSCPPADRWLRNLEEHPGLWRQLIPMAFHVDYWDNLGWPDRFASAAFSQRQRDYRRSGALSSVYTPGFVVNGQEWRGWFRHPNLDLSPQEKVGRLSMDVEPGVGVAAEFSPEHGFEGVKLQANLAILGFGLESRIGGGENRGRTLKENFVVLNHTVSRAGDGRRWSFNWPEFTSAEANRLALVVWLVRPGSAEPVQAVGGWLPDGSTGQ